MPLSFKVSLKPKLIKNGFFLRVNGIDPDPGGKSEL